MFLTQKIKRSARGGREDGLGGGMRDVLRQSLAAGLGVPGWDVGLERGALRDWYPGGCRERGCRGGEGRIGEGGDGIPAEMVLGAPLAAPKPGGAPLPPFLHPSLPQDAAAARLLFLTPDCTGG